MALFHRTIWVLAFTSTLVAAGVQVVHADECSPTCAPYFRCESGQCVFDGGCEPQSYPGCGNCTCQTCVCNWDPYCCTGSWDALCVARCNDLCGGCGVQEVCGDGQCTSGETCTNCPSDCGNCSPQCGAITSIGCCQGLALVRCQGGALNIENCVSAGYDSCGWSLEEDRYACGEQGSDPSGEFPAQCPTEQSDVVENDANVAQCQGVSFSGCCLGNTLVWCDWAGLHSLDCDTNPAPFNTCGWNDDSQSYDCGGLGADPTGEHPKFCPTVDFDVQEEVVAAPQCKVGTLVSVGCQSVGFQGCCSETGGLFFCEQGKYLCELNCSDLPSPSNTCGWHSAGSSGYFDCGGDGEDPSGLHPLLCGPLDIQTDVVEDTSPPLPSCPGIPTTGCCDGPILTWCEQGVERTYDCLQLASDPVFGAYVNCGTNPDTGFADCIKKPDPSPPECIVEIPDETVETPPDSPPDVFEMVDADLVQDLLEDFLDSHKTEDGVDASQADDNPFIIPRTDTVVEPEDEETKGGGGGGCSHSDSVPGWPLWIFMLVILAIRSRSSTFEN